MENTENTTVELTNEEGQQEEVKTYTKDEVDALLQREADRRVSSALAKQQREYEKKLSLSGLDETSRKQAEKDNRIQELEEKLRDYQILQNKNEIVKVLSARNLSPQFADLIAIDDDIESAQKKIEALDNLVKKSVQEEVKRRLASPAPKVGAQEGELNRARFEKMTLKERQDLYASNPDLYKKLAGK